MFPQKQKNISQETCRNRRFKLSVWNLLAVWCDCAVKNADCMLLHFLEPTKRVGWRYSLPVNQSISMHPCFSHEAHFHYGRIHLPVAPRCNISCKFCDRKYDCVNESRPGVTSKVLDPEEAIERLERALAAEPRLRVVGVGHGRTIVQ